MGACGVTWNVGRSPLRRPWFHPFWSLMGVGVSEAQPVKGLLCPSQWGTSSYPKMYLLSTFEVEVLVLELGLKFVASGCSGQRMVGVAAVIAGCPVSGCEGPVADIPARSPTCCRKFLWSVSCPGAVGTCMPEDTGPEWGAELRRDFSQACGSGDVS